MVVQFHSEPLVHLELVNIVLLILSRLCPGTLRLVIYLCTLRVGVHSKGRGPKTLLFFWILSKLPPLPQPSPQFGQLVQLFLNAKNADLSDIQNDSKILLQ